MMAGQAVLDWVRQCSHRRQGRRHAALDYKGRGKDVSSRYSRTAERRVGYVISSTSAMGELGLTLTADTLGGPSRQLN